MDSPAFFLVNFDAISLCEYCFIFKFQLAVGVKKVFNSNNVPIEQIIMVQHTGFHIIPKQYTFVIQKRTVMNFTKFIA
jgi:hypothetical protein